LAGGYVEREKAVGTDVGLARGGEGHGEAGLRLGGTEAAEEEQGEEQGTEAGHGRGTTPSIASLPWAMASVARRGKIGDDG
jgi:hypothetical protein